MPRLRGEFRGAAGLRRSARQSRDRARQCSDAAPSDTWPCWPDSIHAVARWRWATRRRSGCSGPGEPGQAERPDVGKFRRHARGNDAVRRGYIGRLTVDWGPGMRSWIQRADRQPKPIEEILRAYRELDIPAMCASCGSFPIWRRCRLPGLRCCASRGVYLLTCPGRANTMSDRRAAKGDSYPVGWPYWATGHGGNVALESRGPSDY